MKSISKHILSASFVGILALVFTCKIYAGEPLYGMQHPFIVALDYSSSGVTGLNAFTPDYLTNFVFGYGIASHLDTPSLGTNSTVTHFYTALDQNDSSCLGVRAISSTFNGSFSDQDHFLFLNPDAVVTPGKIETQGIQALAIHGETANGPILYMLTGYYICHPDVYIWVPEPRFRSGGVVIGPIHIGPPAMLHTNVYGLTGCPIGFTVLPNGNYLVQDYDPSPIYREYYRNGPLKKGGLFVDLSELSDNTLGEGYGVCVASDQQSLYFNAASAILRTDLNGNLLSIENNGITGFGGMIGISALDTNIAGGGLETSFGNAKLSLPQYAASTAAPSVSSTLVNAQRSQQVYKSSQFPSDPIIITALHFRPAESPYGSAFSNTIGNIQINLSTTTNSPGHLSTTFANNAGPDDTMVYSNSLIISSAYIGDDTGPRDSDIVIHLEEPFRYYPTNGNLLLDIRHYSNDSGNGAYTSAFDESDDAGSRVVGTNPSASTAGTSDSMVDAVDFTYYGPNECVAPNYTAFKASTNFSGTLVTTQRVQQVYQSLQFPRDSMFITELHFRPAEFPHGGAFSNTISDIQINLSTTTNHVDGLSTNFSDNVGADDMVVYSGPLTISSSFTGNDNGARDNDIIIHLQTAFAYFPTNGNLLLDIRHFSDDSGNGAFTSMFKESDDTGSRVMSANPNASTASSADSGVDAVDFIYQGGGSVTAPNYTAFTATSDASATFVSPLRSQQVYKSSQFPLSPIKVTELRFRPGTPPYGGAFSTTISNIQINLSTTTNSPDGLNTTFANNVGTNDTVVYSGSLHISSAYTGDDTGPRDNDIVIHLQTPFIYNPSVGNLLLDIRHFSNDSGNGAFNSAFGESDDAGSRIVSTSPTATTATFSDSAVDIVKFVYSDE